MLKKRMIGAVLACLSGIVVLFGGFAGNAKAGILNVVHTFNDVTSAMIFEDTGGPVSWQNVPFDITNNTGVTWTDFHMKLVGFTDLGLSYDFMEFGDVGGDGVIYTGPGTATFADLNSDALGLNDGITIDGLNIANNGVLSFTVDIFGGFAGTGFAKFQIWATPSVTTTGKVPEPASLALFAFGLAGLGFARRRRAA